MKKIVFIAFLLFSHIAHAFPLTKDNLTVEFCSQSKVDILPDSFSIKSTIFLTGKNWTETESKARQAEEDINKLFSDLEGVIEFAPNQPEFDSYSNNGTKRGPQQYFSMLKPIIIEDITSPEDVKEIENRLRSKFERIEFEFTPNISNQLTKQSEYQLIGLAYKSADEHLKTILTSMDKHSGEIISIAPSSCSVSQDDYSSYNSYSDDAASKAGKKILNRSFWIVAKVK